MDVRRQHINLEYTGKRTSGAKREQVTHWGGHAFTMAMIVATHGTQDFSIVLMGKALKRRVVVLLASAPASTSLNILCYSGQTKYCNTEKRGLEGGKKAGREKHVSKVKGWARVVSTDIQYVCFKPLASTFELDLVHFGRNLTSSATDQCETAFKCEALHINQFERWRSNIEISNNKENTFLSVNLKKKSLFLLQDKIAIQLYPVPILEKYISKLSNFS